MYSSTKVLLFRTLCDSVKVVDVRRHAPVACWVVGRAALVRWIARLCSASSPFACGILAHWAWSWCRADGARRRGRLLHDGSPRSPERQGMQEPGMNQGIDRAIVQRRLPVRGRRVPQLQAPMRPHPVPYRSGGILKSSRSKDDFDQIWPMSTTMEKTQIRLVASPMFCCRVRAPCRAGIRPRALPAWRLGAPRPAGRPLAATAAAIASDGCAAVSVVC